MYRDIIIKMNEDFIATVKNTAKSTSIENLKSILFDMKNNPEEFHHYDVNIVIKLFTEEYNIRIEKNIK